MMDEGAREERPRCSDLRKVVPLWCFPSTSRHISLVGKGPGPPPPAKGKIPGSRELEEEIW